MRPMSNVETLTPADFVLARIAEDEAVAEAAAAAGRPRGGWGFSEGAAGDRWQQREGSGMLYTPVVENSADAALWDDEGGCDYMAPAPDVAAHIARHDPEHVLTQCARDRRLVDLHQTVESRYEGDPAYCRSCCDDREGTYDMPHYPAPCPTILALAAVYADHPDYREEWRP